MAIRNIKMEQTKKNMYAKGKIYKLMNLMNDDIYIGSTCSPLKKRLNRHTNEATHQPCPVHRYYNNLGWEHVKIVLIEEFPCESKMELERQERKWIEELKPTLNKNIPTRTQRERNLQPHIQQKNAEYRATHKERIKQVSKEYYKKNKEDLKAKNSQRRNMNKDEYNRNRREKRAMNRKEKQSSKTKEERYQQRQEKIQCECGCEVSKSNFARHSKSHLHQQWLQNQPSTSSS